MTTLSTWTRAANRPTPPLQGADQNVRNEPKRKGEFSYLVSPELGEKEKRVMRDEEILALPTFMRSVEVVEQPCRVQ